MQAQKAEDDKVFEDPMSKNVILKKIEDTLETDAEAVEAEQFSADYTAALAG